MTSHIVALVGILSLVASCAHGRRSYDSPAEDYPDAARVETRPCRYAADDLSQLELFQTLTNGQRACMGDHDVVLRQLMTEESTMEDMRTVIRGVCDEGEPEFYRCLTMVTADARLCFDVQDTAYKMYLVVKDFIHAVVETTCSGHGLNQSVGFTVLMYELVNLHNESMTVAEKCLATLEETRFTNGTEFTPEFSHYRYQTIRNIKMCVVDVIHAENKSDASDVVANYFDEILSKMTCICFETLEVVSCEDVYVDIDM